MLCSRPFRLEPYPAGAVDIQTHALGTRGGKLQGGLPAGPGLGRGSLLQEHPELPLEVGDLLEVLVDAGVPDVRDLVELLQLREDLEPDLLAGDLGPLAAQAGLHP